MWLYTNQGHLSVVEDMNNSARVLVRARNQKALAAFKEYKVEFLPFADYKYRIHMAKEDFKIWMNNYIDNMGYTNFKNSLYYMKMTKKEVQIFHEVYKCALQLKNIDQNKNT